MDRLLSRMDFIKQIIPKNQKAINFRLLDSRANEFINNFIKRISSEKDRDELTLEASKAYASLTRLLHENNGEIEAKDRLMLGAEIRELNNSRPEDPNRYLAYFRMLIDMDNTPFTTESLKTRFSRLYELPEFSKDIPANERITREKALFAAYSVLSQILSENNDRYENPEELVNIEAKTFYAKSETIDQLSEDEKILYERLNDAKRRSLKNFLPSILLKSKVGIISKESVEQQYRDILKMLPYGQNTDFKTLLEMEKIYQAIQVTISENGGALSYSDKNKILTTYERNIPKVKNQASIALLFSKNHMLTQRSLKTDMNKLLDDETPTDTAAYLEEIIDFEFAYCVLTDVIKQNGGSCSSEVAREAYTNALDMLENYKELVRQENRNPYKMFPKESVESADEIYLKYLEEARNLIENSTNLSDIYEYTALLKVRKELLEMVKDPAKMRELEEVTFKVDQSDSVIRIGICDLQFIRNLKQQTIATFENNVGDQIEVIRIGKLGFGAIRQENGKATYSDHMTTEEYAIRKTYHSRVEGNELPEQKTFIVFSKNIIADRIMKNPTLYSMYANQIFSDLSLQTAIEKNGGLIASADYINRDGQKVPEIYFDNDTLDACIQLRKNLNEYESKVTKNDSRATVLTRTRNYALLGVGNIPLEHGYGTRIMLHENGDDPENDTLYAYEWSDILKEQNIQDVIRKSGRKIEK